MKLDRYFKMKFGPWEGEKRDRFEQDYKTGLGFLICIAIGVVLSFGTVLMAPTFFQMLI